MHGETVKFVGKCLISLMHGVIMKINCPQSSSEEPTCKIT